MTVSPARQATGWRARAPHFAAFFDRPNDALDVAVFLATVGAAMVLTMYGTGGGLAGAGVALLSTTQVALFIWALAATLRFATRRRLGCAAYPIAAAAVGVVLFVDRVHFGFFRQHVSLAIAEQTIDALRSGALPVDRRGVLAGIATTGLTTMGLATWLKVLALVPRPRRAGAMASHLAIPALLAVGTASSLRDCTLGATSPGVHAVRSVTPWDATSYVGEGATVVQQGRDVALFADERPWSEARSHRDALLASARAQSRPDILVIHVESLRFDMLRADVMPNVSVFAKECLTTPYHYTTGTNTGTGVFGLLHGLTAESYPPARAARAQPIPLEVLRKLGYSISAFFSSNFGTYDELYDLFFKGLAGFTYDGIKQPVWQADAQMIDAWLARLATAKDAEPRFDYVILDSTHFDYSYPSDFERFTPAIGLDLGFRDGVAVKMEDVNDRMKSRAPFVRNRYQNAILYADSLIAKMLGALRNAHRMERTVVVVTGDHGEEFWERGAFGHGFFDLSNEQSRVPFLMRLPGGGSSRYRYSSHADMFPTIFDAMGLEPRELPFMNGKSLLRFDPSLDAAVVGYGVTGKQRNFQYAVVGDGLKVLFRGVWPFPVTEVTTDDDDHTSTPPGVARVDGLVVRAIASRQLR